MPERAAGDILAGVSEDARRRAQQERALGAWELVVLDAPEASVLETVRRALRAKRFERAALRAALPGAVRRGARVDLEPVRDALRAAGVRCELRRRETGSGAPGD